jgi:hypothetical protein
VLFEGTGNVLQQSANLFWDNTNGRLGIGTASPTGRLQILGSGTTSATNSLVVQNSSATNSLVITDDGKVTIGRTAGAYVEVGTLSNFYNTSVGYNHVFRIGGSEVARIASTGNVLINTTTDAGFKLDVNGTARVKGLGTTTAITFSVQNSSSTNLLTVTDAGSFATTTSNFSSVVTNNSNSFQVTGSIAAIRVGSSITIASSSILQADSTTQGFLPPRMTTTQKNAIASPAAGLVVYDTTLGKLCVRGAAAWETITSL